MNEKLLLGVLVVLALGCTSDNPAYEGGGPGSTSEGATEPTGTGRVDTGPSEGSTTRGTGPTSLDTGATAGDDGELVCPRGCGEHAVCVDQGEGPACACEAGYEGDGFMCTLVPSLDSMSWQLDCMGNSRSCFNDDVCVVDAPPTEHEVLHIDQAQLIGDPMIIYEVRLWLRGVVEPKAYIGGETNDHWNEGGMPASDGWNVAYLQVDDPMRRIHINAGEPLARYCFAIDQEIIVRVRGGASVAIGVSDSNNCAIQNLDENGDPISVRGVDEPLQPHAGQFLVVETMQIVPLGD